VVLARAHDALLRRLIANVITSRPKVKSHVISTQGLTLPPYLVQQLSIYVNVHGKRLYTAHITADISQFTSRFADSSLHNFSARAF
jgi:hypothetical protein